jgi:hypothetical protein
MNIVSIDFSLNSPGICIFDDISKNYTFISYIKSGLGTKKELKLQEEFSILPGCVLIEQPNFELNKDFSGGELAKILRYKEMASSIMNLILTHTQWEDGFLFAFEGTSYGSSNTNNVMDLSAAAAILKLKIIETLAPKDILTVAPSTIKKHAGKGNMKKDELFVKFKENCLNDPSLESHPIFEFVANLEESKKVPKPLDDLIDAYFLNHLIQPNLTSGR